MSSETSPAPQDFTERIKEHSAFVRRVRQEIGKVVVGQSYMIDRLLVGLLTGGHVLLEGVPGLAKTLTVKSLSECFDMSFQRIQFTPDLLPADLVGTMIYDQRSQEFVPRKGPVFTNLLLTDEINRAPAKVQSALLEAMQEHQVTVGGTTHALPELFMVMATQNPLEQAGTYPLPEAQLDRFLLHVVIDYPGGEEELAILQRNRARLRGEGEAPGEAARVTVETLLAAREEVARIHIDEPLERYIVDLVGATRELERHLPDRGDAVEVGASPRAALAIAQAASATAYLRDRDYVTPDDILEVAPDCLRHRLILAMGARLERVGRDELIGALLDVLPVP